MPVCFAISTERAFARPFRSTRSAFLLGCEWNYFVRCEWLRNRWHPFFLAASDAEEFSGSVTDPALLLPSSSRNARLRDGKGCQWARARMVSAEEPSRSRLDECFLTGRYQAPRQRSSPFFPEVHDELTNCGTPLTRLVYVLLLPLLSHQLTAIGRSFQPGSVRVPPLAHDGGKRQTNFPS